MTVSEMATVLDDGDRTSVASKVIVHTSHATVAVMAVLTAIE